jgi:hypothetical protein
MDPVMALLPESLRVSESEVVVFLLKSMVAVESDSRLPHVYLGEVGEYFKNLSSYLKQSIRRNLGDLTIVLPDFKGLSREILEYQSMLEAFSGTPKATSTVFFDTVESSGATASAGAGAPAVDSGI